MTEPIAVDSRSNLPTRIDNLISIFYGLAIASGIEKSVDIYTGKEPFEWYFVSLSILALCVAVSDWIYYHVVLETRDYKGATRLIMDLIFPILLFFLFPAAMCSDTFALILFIYFLLSAVYGLVFISACLIPVEAIILAIGCSAVVAFGNFCPSMKTSSDGLVTLCFDVAAVGMWTSYSVYQINKRLKELSDARKAK